MPDQSPSLFDAALKEYQKALAPLTGIKTAGQLTALFVALGYDLTGSGQINQVLDAIKSIAVEIEKLPGLVENEAKDQSLANTVGLISAVGGCVAKVMSLADSLKGALKDIDAGELERMAAALPVRLLDYLVCGYLRENHGRIFALTTLLGITKTADAPLFELVPAAGGGSKTVCVSAVTWKYIPELFTDISGVFDEEYGWKAGGDVDAGLLFRRLSGLMGAFALPGGLYLQDPDVSARLGFDQAALSAGINELRVPIYQDGVWPVSYAETGLALSPLPGAGGGFGGIALLPYTGAAADIKFDIGGNFELAIPVSFKSSMGFALKLRPPANIELDMPHGAADIDFDAQIGAHLYQKASSPFIIVGDKNASRLSVDMLDARFFASYDSGDMDIGIELGAGELALVIARGDGDGFLQKILPEQPFTASLGLALGYSVKKGFYVKQAGRDASSIEYSVNIDKKIDFITIQSLLLRLTYGADRLKLTVALSGGLNIGPVAASVSQLGLEMNLDFAGGGAGLSFGFKPPNGVGLVIDSPVIKGGGYLSIDTEKGRYVGILQVKLMSFGITIYGLLDTKDSAGQPLKSGYSLLLMVFCEFSPIQLGFGFVLTGVGGLLALHRRLETDVLREQMRNRALDYIMFPSDPIGQAPAMTDTLSKIFPPQDGVFVIAPMVRIGWGSPDPILKVDIGIMLELPSLNKIALLGRMKLALPNEKDAVAIINLDSLGILRLDQGSLSVDAQLYDSKIAKLALAGEMALRLSWKGNSEFLFSMGGYHPAFKAPPGFPSLQRMSATLSLGDWFNLRLESYMALTSNTLQFGARVDLNAHVGDIVGKGSLFFDALIYFNPFGLQVDFGASISIEVYGVNLFAVSFEAHLSGPSPWHIWGKAKFHVLLVDLEFNLDARIGAEAVSAPPDPVDAVAAVLAEIARTANWGALPPDGFQAVTLKTAKTEKDVILLHPLSSLRFSQKAAPLNVRLEKFGNAAITGDSTIAVTGVALGDGAPGSAPDIPKSDVYEEFAPAQYFNLTDTQKLGSPSFVSYVSGFEAGFDALDFDGQSPETDFDYEIVYIDAGPAGGVVSAAETAAGGGRIPRPAVRPLIRKAIAADAALSPRELSIAASLSLSARSGPTRALLSAKPVLPAAASR